MQGLVREEREEGERSGLVCQRAAHLAAAVVEENLISQLHALHEVPSLRVAYTCPANPRWSVSRGEDPSLRVKCRDNLPSLSPSQQLVCPGLALRLSTENSSGSLFIR
jgi:hypothetical protein